MQPILATALLLVLSTTSALAKRDVVFVHGLAGFGPDELFGIGYWGFGSPILSDESIFPSSDWQTHEASVGPVSSNWDRACELYAQITGTQVDYGKAHSNKYGHTRMGKVYTKPMVEGWSPEKTISFVGHSMGGQTIRLLEILMNEGDADEIAATDPADLSPLFKGGHRGYFRSITSISTPHDGTTLLNLVDNLLDVIVKPLVLAFAALGGVDANSNEAIYDFDLDHFGLERQSGERFSQYINRVFSADVWKPGFKDTALYDLSLEGAAELNRRGEHTYPTTYYFSVLTEQTFRGLWPLFHNMHYSEPAMSIYFNPTGTLIGTYGGNFGGWNDWHENDGLVPLYSQQCPRSGYREPVGNCLNSIPRDNVVYPGRYYQVKTNRDHGQIIGATIAYNNKGIYRDVAGRILATEFSAQAVLAREEADLAEANTAPISQTQLYVSGGVGAAVGCVATIGAAFLVARARKARRTTDAPSTPPTTTSKMTSFSSANPAFDL